jgi:hypothetical protein
MELKKIFLEQIGREVATTRNALDRAPEKPHKKSMTLGYLSAPVATMPGWKDSS